MEYQFVAIDNIRSRMRESDLTADVIYKHFLNYTDECIYVIEDESLIGIITPGDLHRFYISDGENSYLNKKFTYLDDVDYEKAKEVFERIPMVHEVPVIKENVFLGIVKSEEQKPSEEWLKIREGFLPYRLGKMDRRKREISFFLEHTQAKIYVYSRVDRKKLKWNDSDWALYYMKRQYPNGSSGLREMSECERKMFFGSNYSEEYVEEFIKEYRMLRVKTYNGMSKICDISGRYFTVSDGKRKLCISANVGGGGQQTNLVYWAVFQFWCICE